MPKNLAFRIRFTEQDRELLEKEAAKYDVSLAHVLRQLIRQHLQNPEADDKGVSSAKS